MSRITRRNWQWEEAFDKSGFDDGDGKVMTDTVAAVLCANGYIVTTHIWGLHNTVITSIDTADTNVALIPAGTHIGYDDPRRYLPRHVVRILDHALPV